MDRGIPREDLVTHCERKMIKKLNSSLIQRKKKIGSFALLGPKRGKKRREVPTWKDGDPPLKSKKGRRIWPLLFLAAGKRRECLLQSLWEGRQGL